MLRRRRTRATGVVRMAGYKALSASVKELKGQVEYLTDLLEQLHVAKFPELHQGCDCLERTQAVLALADNGTETEAA